MRKKILTGLIVLVIYCMIPAVYTIAVTGVSCENVTDGLIDGRRIVINYKYSSKTVDINKFITMVLAERFSASCEIEVLKAESIMVRTDIYRLIGDNMSMDSDELGMKFLTENQMKNKWGDKFEENYNLIADCVEATGSTVITYNDKLIEARYTTAANGTTLSGEKLLGDDYKYLAGADCGNDIESPDYLAVVTISNKDFIKKMKAEFSDIGLSEENLFSKLQIISKEENGYVLKLQVGNVIMSGSVFCEILQINSPCMTFEAQDKGIKITTKGKGDGFGVSLYTADIMAKNGKNYSEILNYFYSGIEFINK